jgi:hypothetical protein
MPKQAVAIFTTCERQGFAKPSQRRKIESAIEAHLDAANTLIAFLDGLDGDCDLEIDGGDSPEPEQFV